MDSEPTPKGSATHTPAPSPSTPPPLPLSPPSTPTMPPVSLGGVAMSKAETVLLSGTGDVLVSRCRESSKAYMVPRHVQSPPNELVETPQPHSDMASWWESNCEGLNHAEALCPCNCESTAVDTQYFVSMESSGGLKGGNPPKEGSSDMAVSDVKSEENSAPQTSTTAHALSSTIPVSPKPGNSSNAGFNADEQSNDAESTADHESDGFLLLPSFDYSHFADDGNDMIPGALEQSRDCVASAEDIPSSLPAIIEGGENSILENMEGNLNGLKGPVKPPLQSLEQTSQHSGVHATGFIASEMLRPEQRYSVVPPLVMHGVPTFLSSLPQIRITQVSAHPLGSHVLLISKEAILFSFGLNDHGQLGNGSQSSVKDENRGFVTTPTIVTPLLENGGKAITCAAGVDHSLVVVETDGRRLGRLKEKHRSSRRKSGKNAKHNSVEITRVTSSPPRIIGTEDDDNEHSPSNSRAVEPSELMSHHQLYGFGRNDCMKLGLVNPVIKENPKETEDEEEDVLLPRRVALHCNVWPGTAGRPSAGIFAIAASAHHSAALIRRPTGAVELYTWGNADDGALGPFDVADTVSLVDDLSREKSSSPSKARRTRKTTKSEDSGTKAQLNGEHSKPPPRRKVASPTIVRTLSYSPSYGGAGHAPFLDGGSPATPNGLSPVPTNNASAEYPMHIALGPKCTFVVTSRGRCVSFGTSNDGLLGRGSGITKDVEPKSLSFPVSAAGRATEITSLSVGARHAVGLLRDGSVYAWGASSGGRLGFANDPEAAIRQSKNKTEGNDVSQDSSKHRRSDIQWLPQRIEFPRVSNRGDPGTKHLVSFSDNDIEISMAACSLDGKRQTGEATTDSSPSRDDGDVPVVHACAGYDSTVFVTNAGRVLSCGKRSGRLGIGEVTSNVCPPKPMFGGLQLWRQAHNHEMRKGE